MVVIIGALQLSRPMTSQETQPGEPANGCPFSRSQWTERPKAESIPCPALLALYNHGMLNPDSEGNVSIKDLDHALALIGVSKSVRDVLVKGAEGTDSIEGSFNLFALRDSKLDHTGSTGVRDPEVSPAKLQDALLRFSEDGKMYSEHFAAAANRAQQIDPGLKGTATQTVEFRALLEVFGRVDEQGRRYLTTSDVTDLWLHGRFPEGWTPRSAEEIGKDDVLKGVALLAIQRVLDSIGL